MVVGDNMELVTMWNQEGEEIKVEPSHVETWEKKGYTTEKPEEVEDGPDS